MSTGTDAFALFRRKAMRLRSSPGGVNAERRISSGMRLAMTDRATSAEADTTTTLAST